MKNLQDLLKKREELCQQQEELESEIDQEVVNILIPALIEAKEWPKEGDIHRSYSRPGISAEGLVLHYDETWPRGGMDHDSLTIPWHVLQEPLLENLTAWGIGKRNAAKAKQEWEQQQELIREVAQAQAFLRKHGKLGCI